MANVMYTYGAHLIFNGTIDLVTDTIKVALVVSGSSFLTDEDAEHVSDITTLNEYAGTNYARATLSNKAINIDTVNDRSEFDNTVDTVFSSLGANTTNSNANCVGFIIFKDNGSDATNDLICAVDLSGAPFTGNGGDVTIQWNAEGIIQATTP